MLQFYRILYQKHVKKITNSKLLCIIIFHITVMRTEKIMPQCKNLVILNAKFIFHTFGFVPDMFLTDFAKFKDLYIKQYVNV